MGNGLRVATMLQIDRSLSCPASDDDVLRDFECTSNRTSQNEFLELADTKSILWRLLETTQSFIPERSVGPYLVYPPAS